jgi:hypothetical protein
MAHVMEKSFITALWWGTHTSVTFANDLFSGQGAQVMQDNEQALLSNYVMLFLTQLLNPWRFHNRPPWWEEYQKDKHGIVEKADFCHIMQAFLDLGSGAHAPWLVPTKKQQPADLVHLDVWTEELHTILSLIDNARAKAKSRDVHFLSKAAGFLSRYTLPPNYDETKSMKIPGQEQGESAEYEEDSGSEADTSEEEDTTKRKSRNKKGKEKKEKEGAVDKEESKAEKPKKAGAKHKEGEGAEKTEDKQQETQQKDGYVWFLFL